jgi:putative DNA primase/helicase
MSKHLKIVTPEKVLNFDMIGDKVITAEEQVLLKEMNDDYCHVVIGGKHRVMAFKPCSVNGRKMTFETPSDFCNYFHHKPLVAGFNQGSAWFRWAGKTFYPEGIGYYPCVDRAPKNVFNTFQPFPCQPIAGDVSLILSHITDVLCSGDQKASDYFIQWLAHIIQKPMDKPTVAVLMKSAEGTGKGTLYKLLKKILGSNAHQVNGAYQLTGRFNAVIAGRLLVFGDEVDLTSKAVFDKAKGIISESTISMELKGIDPEPIPNYARFIFAGNHDNIIAAGTRERRFLVLEPSTHKTDDHQYWQALNHVIDTDGGNSFLYYLINTNLAEFSPFKAPATKGLIDEKLVSLKPAFAYIYNELLSEKSFGGAVKLDATELVRMYVFWMDINEQKPSTASARSQIGRAMLSLNIPTTGRSGRGQGKCYNLPESDILREKFASLLGHEPDDIF